MCENDGSMTDENLITCLQETFGVNKDISKSANYTESHDNIGFHYDETSELWYDSKDNYGLGDKIDVIATLNTEDNIYLFIYMSIIFIILIPMEMILVVKMVKLYQWFTVDMIKR